MTGQNERLDRIRAARPIAKHPAIAENRAPRAGADAELMHVNMIARDMQEYEAALEHAIARAVFRGASWAEVGKMLGVSKQSAQQKWAKRLD